MERMASGSPRRIRKSASVPSLHGHKGCCAWATPLDLQESDYGERAGAGIVGVDGALGFVIVSSPSRLARWVHERGRVPRNPILRNELRVLDVLTVSLFPARRADLFLPLLQCWIRLKSARLGVNWQVRCRSTALARRAGE